MRLLISALAAAGLFALSLGSYAADEPYTAQPAREKPGRAIDDGTVKTPKKLKEHGRAIDDGTVKSGGATDKPGRALDESADAVKAPNKKKYGRAIDDGTVKATKKPKQHGRAIDEAKAVKSGPTDKPGRAAEEEKK